MLKHTVADMPKKSSRGPKPTKLDPSQLLDAAQKVFARDGLNRSSIRAIAREAKCDPSLFYYHFENKEAIFAAILERKFGLLLPELEKVAGVYASHSGGKGKPSINEHGRTPLQEALWQTLMIYHVHLKDDAGFRGIIRGNASFVHGAAYIELKKYLSSALQIITDFFRSGIKSGELRQDINPSITTFFLLRNCIEMMDTFPFFSSIFLSMPPDEALALGEAQWFKLFWLGIANTTSK